MLHRDRIWQVSDWNLTVEQMEQIAKESGWNFCLCQAFHLVINGRDIYFLNDSIHPDPLHYFQEYAPIVVTTRTETPTGWLCTGYQIESLTVNAQSGTPLLNLLLDLGNSEKDCGKNAVTFRLERGEQHTCANCM